jgi:hypothetical protein
MLEEAVTHLKKPTSLEKIYFVLFDAAAVTVFNEIWSGMQKKGAADGVSPS